MTPSHDNSTPSEDRRTQRPDHWTVRVYRYITGGGVVLLVAGSVVFWLFSDQHNDARYSKIADVPGLVQTVGDIRYVQISSDNERRDNLKQQLAEMKLTQERTAAEAKSQLGDVQNDLREVRNLLWTLANKPTRPERDQP